MSKNISGWDFLQSKTRGFLGNNSDDGDKYIYADGSGYYKDEDGTDAYIYSDGSGYYHGADGSDGYIYSDGSAYYHGADGTDAYIYSDGSGYYHGADGSEGNIDSNGTGAYTDADGETSYFDSDDYEEENDNLTFSTADLIGTLIGVGVVGFAIASSINNEESEKQKTLIAEAQKIKAQMEYEKEVENRAKKENRRNWRKRHRKFITIIVMLFILGIISAIGCFEYQKLIPIGHNVSEFIGIEYTDAVLKFKEAGFTNIIAKEISDLTISREKETNLVTEVRLLFANTFNDATQYPSNMPIILEYHTVELYRAPYTSKDAKGMNYKDVIREFEKIGFINISTEVEYDIIAGLIIDDGEVKSIKINGNQKYDSTEKFRLDAEVVIVYHTLIGNKST